MNGLTMWIKAEVECWEPVGLAQMMKLAQRVENRELTRREAGLKMNSKGKARSLLSFNKVNIPLKLNEFKYEGMVSDENLTLRGTTTMKNWLEVL